MSLFSREKTFFDIKLFNSDTILTSNNTGNRIADAYFRLDPSEVDHVRIEYSFEKLLTDVGGTSELLIRLANFLFGGYLSFHSSIEIMRSLYHHNPKLRKLNTRRKGFSFR